MSKDMWFDEFERHLNELEDAGVPPKVAYDKAADMAEKSLPAKLADMADAERKRRAEQSSAALLKAQEESAEEGD
jgi:hypothetical protein